MGFTERDRLSQFFALPFFAAIYVKLALAFVHRFRVGLDYDRLSGPEYDLVVRENLSRLTAEARLRLDPVNANADANIQLLGELMSKYFPPTRAGGIETWWSANLGWVRADEALRGNRSSSCAACSGSETLFRRKSRPSGSGPAVPLPRQWPSDEWVLELTATDAVLAGNQIH